MCCILYTTSKEILSRIRGNTGCEEHIIEVQQSIQFQTVRTIWTDTLFCIYTCAYCKTGLEINIIILTEIISIIWSLIYCDKLHNYYSTTGWITHLYPADTFMNHVFYTVQVIKKFACPVRFTGVCSKTTGLEQTGNGMALSIPFFFASFKGESSTTTVRQRCCTRVCT